MLACVRSRFYFSSILGDIQDQSRGLPDAFDLLMRGMHRMLPRTDGNVAATPTLVSARDELCGSRWPYTPMANTKQQPWMSYDWQGEDPELYRMWNPRLPAGGSLFSERVLTPPPPSAQPLPR